MKLSVIIPYYNADKWIGRMLDSLLKQDLSAEEYEIIVVDDGSKVEPLILKRYVENCPLIKYVWQENAGPGTARNTGISMATGEYIFFCDSDDYIAEDVLGGLYNIAHEHRLDMLFHQIRRIKEGEIVINPRKNFNKVDIYQTGKDYFALPVKDKITTGVWQFIINRNLVNKAKLVFPENRIMNEDSSFLIDAVMAAGKTGKVDVDVYNYVQNPQSLIHLTGKVKQAERWCDNMIAFIQKLTDILENKKLTEEMPKGCIDSIKWVRNQKAFIMLVGACQNLPSSSFYNKMAELKQLGAYPKAFGRYKILKCFFLNPVVMKTLNFIYASKKRRNTH